MMEHKTIRRSIGPRSRGRTVLYMFLGLVLAVGVLAPVLWMFMTSIMRPVDLTAKPLKLIPESVTFDRYRQIFASDNGSDPAYVFRIALILLSSLLVLF